MPAWVKPNHAEEEQRPVVEKSMTIKLKFTEAVSLGEVISHAFRQLPPSPNTY